MTNKPENPPLFSNATTLRDYFAAAALQGMLASPGEPKNGNSAKSYAHSAYYHADAMLAERGKE